MRAVHVFQMNHRKPPMSVTLAARLHARLATNAAVGVDEEFVLIRNRHCCFGTYTYSGRHVFRTRGGGDTETRGKISASPLSPPLRVPLSPRLPPLRVSLHPFLTRA